MHLIDTHAHLDYPDFDPDRQEMMRRAADCGVKEIITIGTRLPACEKGVAMAQSDPAIWATVGIHPCDAHTAPPDFLSHIRRLAQSRRVVALGEIGLDYHHLPGKKLTPPDGELDLHHKQRQAAVFREQLSLAAELKLNVVIHQRDSWDDTLAILDEFSGKVRGVFHCFGGSPEQACAVIERGHLVSFTGIVTFKNAQEVQHTAAAVPAGSFMVETDCPYLAPAPHRGKRCEPSHTRLVAEKIAELRGLPVEKIADETTATAQQFFNFAR